LVNNASSRVSWPPPVLAGIEILDHLVVEMRHAERLRVALVAVPDMEDLAERFGAVTVPGEVLRHRHRIGEQLAQRGCRVRRDRSRSNASRAST
jgi:hypothetical protein